MTVMAYRTHPALRWLVLVLSLLGCAPSIAVEPIDPGGGIGGTGITGFGVVQSFGSIFVNGREYILDDHTRISRDGIRVDGKSLKRGDVVRVDGHVDPATGQSVALRVDNEPAMQGRVERVNAAAGTITVLGQIVHVTSETLNDDASHVPLHVQIKPGQRIAVNGLARAGGSWNATRIDRLAPGDERFVLRGAVRRIDFERGRLTVGERAFVLPASSLHRQWRVGEIVRVSGRYARDTLLVDSITPERAVSGTTGRTVEMSGYVQVHAGAGALMVNGMMLRYSDASVFVGGSASNLRTNIPVAVRGRLAADGSVTIGAIVIDVEPMHVTLPGLATPMHREGAKEFPGGSGRSERPAEEHERTEPIEVEKRDVQQLERPEIERPEIEKPEIERPEIERPEIEKPGTE